MALQILPFADKHIEAAARILAARQRRDRALLPFLPQRFEDETAAKLAVETAWARPWSSGAVAVQGDQADAPVLGYLFGSARFDQHSGRAIWVRPASYGLADGVDSEVMRDLYAAAGAKWLEIGCFDHVAMISAADPPLLDAWYSLCFGQQHAYGLLALNDIPASVDLSSHLSSTEFIVRQGTTADSHHLEQLCYITAEHQFGPPTWAPTPAEIMAGRPESYRGVAADEDAVTWLAIQHDASGGEASGEETLGIQIYYEAEPESDDLYVPDRCIELCVAATKADFRGKGVGLALTHAGLAHAKEVGYRFVLTDWRTANLQSSRFWPRRGFQPVVYRLFRRVDERILWANRNNW